MATADPNGARAPHVVAVVRVVRVVVVDDNSDLRQMMTLAAMASEGIDLVGQAADGIEALEVCARERPDAVVLDVEMPRMDGIETLGQLRETHRQTKIVMFSADDRRKDEACQAGADAFFLKLDINPVELLELLAAMVRDEAVA
jgi:DNA-binding NarL/FixJ family response regulator